MSPITVYIDVQKNVWSQTSEVLETSEVFQRAKPAILETSEVFQRAKPRRFWKPPRFFKGPNLGGFGNLRGFSWCQTSEVLETSEVFQRAKPRRFWKPPRFFKGPNLRGSLDGVCNPVRNVLFISLQLTRIYYKILNIITLDKDI